MVDLFSAIGGPRCGYITASVSQARPSDHAARCHGGPVVATHRNRSAVRADAAQRLIESVNKFGTVTVTVTMRVTVSVAGSSGPSPRTESINTLNSITVAVTAAGFNLIRRAQSPSTSL